MYEIQKEHVRNFILLQTSLKFRQHHLRAENKGW